MAREHGIARRTLLRRFKREGLPAARDLVICSRLLVAAAMLETQQRTVEDIAAGVGFGSATPFPRHRRRLTGPQLTQLRSYSGLHQLVTLFCASSVRSRES